MHWDECMEGQEMKWANGAGCVTAIYRRRQQSVAETFGKEIKSLASDFQENYQHI